MPNIQALGTSVRLWLADIHPIAPWLVLAAICFGVDYAIKQFGLAERIERRFTWGKVACVALAALPATILGVAWPAVTSGDTDPTSAVKGAVMRLLVPVGVAIWARLPKPPSSGTGTALLVLMLGLPAFTGCAFWQEAKPVVRTVDDLARDACSLFFGEKMGLDVVDAARAYCATREEWAPFIDPMLAGMDQGGTLALSRKPAER